MDGPNYPPQARAVWDAATPLTHVPEARAWCTSRGLDPQKVEAIDGMRVLRASGWLPGWAASLRAKGYRLVFPLRDHEGAIKSLQFRTWREVEPKYKSLAPTGFQTIGLSLCTHAPDPAASVVVVVEGEPDWLTWATHKAPGVQVMGLRNGTWSKAWAECIAPHARVYIRTDCNDAGNRYAEGVARTLQSRLLWRLQPTDAGGDDNERLQAGTFDPDPAAGCKPMPAPAPTPDQLPGVHRVCHGEPSAYGLQAVEAECARVRSLGKGGRSHGVFVAARALAQLEAGGELPEGYSHSHLLEAVGTITARDFSMNEAKSHIRRGRIKGLGEPRNAPNDSFAQATSRKVRRSLAKRQSTTSTHRSPAKATPQIETDTDHARHLLRIDQRFMTPRVGGKGTWDHAWVDTHSAIEGTDYNIIGLVSDMGTGKTDLLAKLVRDTKADGGTVLNLTHRQALSIGAAKRLGLACYLDLEGSITHHALTCCVDSVHRIAVADVDGDAIEWDLVIIDEVQQFAQHVFGGTIGKRSLQVWNHLEMILRYAKRVVIADAHLNAYGWSFIRRLRKTCLVDHRSDELEIVNTWHDPARVHRYYESREHILFDVCDDLNKGKRVALATTFRRQAHAAGNAVAGLLSPQPDDVESIDSIIAVARANNPDLKVFVVTSTNSKTPEVKAFLADPNAWLEANPVDLLVYSPTIGTGVSIDVPFDSVYGIMHAGIHTANDIFQQLARVRCATVWGFWIEPKRMTSTTDRAAIDEHYRTNVHLARDLCTKFGLWKGREGTRVVLTPTVRAHWATYLDLESHRRSLSNNLLESCLQHSHATLPAGNTQVVEDPLSERVRSTLRDCVKTGGERFDDEEIEAILHARPLTFKRAKRIKDQGVRSRDDELAVTRAYLQHHLCTLVEEEHVRREVKKRVMSKSSRRAYLRVLWSPDASDISQLEAWLDDATKPHSDPTKRALDLFAAHLPQAVRMRVLGDVLAAAGVTLDHIEGRARYTVAHNDLVDSEWATYVEARADRLEAARLRIKPPANLRAAPVQYLKACLDVVGLNLRAGRQTRGEDGKRARIYHIDEADSLATLAWSEPTFKRLQGQHVHNPFDGVADPRFHTDEQGFEVSQPPPNLNNTGRGVTADEQVSMQSCDDFPAEWYAGGRRLIEQTGRGGGLPPPRAP